MTRGWIRWIALACGLLLAAPVHAQKLPKQSGPPPRDVPVLLVADEVTYDRELGVVTARGHVEISQGDRVVHADTVSYNEKSRNVTASGNVAITDAEGNTSFADYVELSGDLKEAAGRGIRMLLNDNSRLAAASGTRTGGSVDTFDHAVYSPCNLCAKDPTRPPLWQIKAVKVTYDHTKHEIQYQDAWLEMFGVPVVYTPYFSNSDGTVKRDTGFLGPKFGVSGKLGFHVQEPFYWNISPDKELTIAPIFSTNEYPVLYGEYRQRVENGEFDIAASGNIANNNDASAGLEKGDFRGHITGYGRFDVDDNWRWGFDLNRATDRTYERLFDFSGDRTLTSRGYAEMFDGRNYASIQGYTFYGTRSTDINSQQPIVAPLVDYSYVGDPVVLGSYFTFDGDAMALSRVEGRSDRRVSVGGGWRLPYTSPLGDVYTIAATARADIYSFNGFDPHDPDNIDPVNGKSDVVGRFFPQISAEWRYPFARDHDGWQEVIEPIAQLVASPNKANFGHIPNEDSLDVEFDDTNLFDPNRFAGLDKVDTGQRATYGLRWSFLTDDGGYASAFVGQSYQFNDNVNFTTGSGLENHLSDIVGSVQVSPIEDFDMLYRFRYDANTLKPRHEEVLLSGGPALLHLDLSYAFLAEGADPNTTFGSRQEVAALISTHFADYWTLFAATRYDVESDRVLNYGGGVQYEDECFDIRVSLERDEFQDQEQSPQWKALFTIGFKNLASFGPNNIYSQYRQLE